MNTDPKHWLQGKVKFKIMAGERDGLAAAVAIMMLLQFDPGQNHGLMNSLVLLWF
jgi:hypothetical protein